ncbi:MAG: hypothetical protein J6N49_04850 [Alphaproteobacteria bacterium]|nr:hypothetical protein [Alphaproteobacteria bacterium]
MIVRIVLGVILGFLLVAYFPLVIRVLPYLLPIAILGIAFIFLRSAPMLAEPLSYGLLAVLLCYVIFLLWRYKTQVKNVLTKKEKIPNLPVINIKGHPQLSALITMTAYTLGLTFVLYLIILLIYVK